MCSRPISALTSLIAAVALVLVSSAALAEQWDPTPKRDINQGGDSKRLPVVFVHGASGCGEQFERQAMHFTSNGYPVNWVVAYDYNSVGPSAGPEGIEKFIDGVLKRTGHAKVNLVGHSRGTLESGKYLSDSSRAAKIAHYASVGGAAATNLNGVPSIAVSGLGDSASRGKGPQASDGGVTAKMPDYQDHVMVCTSDESFEAIYTFFNDGEKPKTMKIEPEAETLIAGFVKSYGQNVPCGGAKVEVWEVARATGRRTSDKPLFTSTTSEDGRWGPFRAQPGQYYEFVVYDKALAKPRHVYREPFSHTDALAYFRITAAADNYTPSPLDKAPKYLTNKNAVFNVRQQNGALLPGIMSLKINGTEIITEAIIPRGPGPAMPTIVALYVADGNENGQSDFAKIEDAVFRAPFVSSVDMFLPSHPHGHVEFQLNDHVLNVPTSKSSETGQINVVFDDYR